MFTCVTVWTRSDSAECIWPAIIEFHYQPVFMKPFDTNVMDTIKVCQDYFGFDLPGNKDLIP